MKINRRNLTSLAGLSAAGLLLPWNTQAGARDKVKTSPMGAL